MTSRESPITVAKQEFDVEPTEPYYFIRYGDVFADQELRSYLDTEAIRHDLASFPGLIYAPAFIDTIFLFLKNGRVVNLTSGSVETAQQAFEKLAEHLEAVGAITTSPNREILTVTHDVLSNTSEQSQSSEHATDETSLSIDFEKIRKQRVAIPLFDPRDRLHFQQADLTIYLPSDQGPDSAQYIYNEITSTLDLERAPEGETFLGFDSEHEMGVLFTRQELLAVFDHHGGSPVETDWAENGAVIVSSFREGGTTTIHVFAADGAPIHNTEESGVGDIAIGKSGRVAAYTHDRKPPVLTICQFEGDGTVSTVDVERYDRVKYVDETEEFFVGPTRDGVLTTALSLDGDVSRELTSDEVESRVARFLAHPDKVPLYEVRSQVQQDPAQFVEDIPALLDMLTNGEFSSADRSAVPEIFRVLAREQPTAFEQHLDQLFSLVSDPAAEYQAESADKVIREIHAANIQREIIVERLHQLVDAGDKKQTERAVTLLATRTADLTAHEGTVDLLIELLDEQMDPHFMLPTVHALQNATVAKTENTVLSKLVANDQVSTLVTLFRFGHDHRGRDEDVLNMTISAEASDAETDEQSLSERETELDSSDLYHLNRRVTSLLRALATAYPNAVVPHLGRILLDLKTESDALENVRSNALGIVEALVDTDPEHLPSAVKRNNETVVELVQHPESPIGEAALRLLSRSSGTQGREILQKIASSSSHKLWQTATSLVDSQAGEYQSSKKDDTGDTIGEATARLTQLPAEAVTPLHLPTPDEIQDYRTTAGVNRSELSQFVGRHRSYLEAMENRVLNPPLSVLLEITVHVTPDDTPIDKFPTGQRIRARRTESDYTVTTLADKAGLSQSRLQAIEAGTVDPRAYEIEQLLIAIGDTEEPASYPNKPPLREAWVKYGTALAVELGRLPKNSELIEHPDAVQDGSAPEREPGFNGEEDIDPDVEMPEPPHWAVFDSWDELLAELRVDNEYRTSGAPLRSALLRDLQHVAERVSGRPTTTAIDEHSEYSYHYYKKEFGGIQAAREAAGIE